MRRTISTVVAVLAIEAALGVAIMYSGAFNVAASEPHGPLGKWILETTMEHSVKMRAASIQSPTLGEERIAKGFREYDEDCVVCHGAPGDERSEVSKGLMPHAPDLAKLGDEWTAAEIFWIVKHGVKMTGMPAWGKSDTDDDLWNVVAFVRRLPTLSADEYHAMRAANARAAGEGERDGKP